MPKQVRIEYEERRARALIEAGLKVFEMSEEELKKQPKGDWRKAMLAAMIAGETTMRLDWISEQLQMGTRAGVCRLAKEAKAGLGKDRKLDLTRNVILQISILNG